MWPFSAKHVAAERPTTGTCNTCKHIVNLADMQKVENGSLYCPEHKVPYDKVVYDRYLPAQVAFYVRQEPWRRVTVDGLDWEIEALRIHYEQIAALEAKEKPRGRSKKNGS